tara:strand:- start:4027 stop:4134 length:108 start_codon:yes stop_codon:yes gene_type:complete
MKKGTLKNVIIVLMILILMYIVYKILTGVLTNALQ